MFESLMQDWGAIVLALIPLALAMGVVAAEVMGWVETQDECSCRRASTVL